MSEPEDRREPDALPGVTAPEQAEALIGHANTRAALEQMLGQGRLPGGILLHGPQGIGKATLAFMLARQILTATGDEDAFRVREQVSAGAHPNLAVLRKAPKEGKGFYTAIRVEDVRNLREALRMTRGRVGHRIAIIDSIDDCNPSAANAMLKTLEEPPAETTFLLVSHRPGALLPTIRSRCHSLPMRPLASKEVASVLRGADPTVSEAELAHAVALSGGRPRRAFEALGLGNEGGVSVLSTWLESPTGHPAGAHLSIAAALAADAAGSAMSFARDILLDWVAKEARDATIARDRMRLASANELWEKARTTFADADSLNLDPRQTLVVVLDAIRRHARAGAPVSGELS